MSDIGDNDENYIEEDYGDDDYEEDYEDEDIIETNKIPKEIIEKEEIEKNDTLLEVEILDFKKNISVVAKNSGIDFLTDFERCEIIGQLAEYILDSKIEVPKKINKFNGNHIKIAIEWFENRNSVPLPFEIKREITPGFFEKLKISELKTHEDFEFFDENDNTQILFSRNFRDKEYDDFA